MTSFSNKLRGRFLAYLILCSLVITTRIAYIVYDKPFYKFGGGQLGTGELERSAVNITRYGTIGNIYSNDSGKSAHVSPLYPFFLSGLYAVFGWNTIAGRIVQELCAIAATTAGLSMLPVVAKTAGLSAIAAWFAAFMLAVMPLNLWVETYGSWEQPYSAFVLLGMLCVFCKLRDQQWKHYRTILWGGMLLGSAALLSPALLPAGVLLMISEMIRPSGERSDVLFGSFFMTCIVVAIITPWTIRNYIALGGIIPLRSNFGLELAIGNNPHANGRTVAGSGDLVIAGHPFSDAGELANLRKMGEYRYMQEKLSSTLHWMSANPGRVFELVTLRFKLFWFPPADMWPSFSVGRKLKAFLYTVIGLAALLQLAYLLVGGHDRAFLLAGTVIGPSLIYMLTHVDLRYRYPIFGLTTVLACCLFATLCETAARAYFSVKWRIV